VTRPAPLTAAGRPRPLDLDAGTPIRLRWPDPAPAGCRLTVADSVTGAVLHAADLPAGSVEHRVPAGTLPPGRRFRWTPAAGADAGAGRTAELGTGPGRTWRHSVPVWAPAPPPDPCWRDYDVTVEVLRSPIHQTGTTPALGAGMDVPGARRVEVLLRCPDQRSGYTWTVDPEVGELVATVRADGAARELGRARWTPGPTERVAVLVELRGDQIVTRVDGVVVHRLSDRTWTAGAAGLGAPPDARARVRSFDVRTPSGEVLVADATALGCGDVGPDGVLQVAERSRGLVPPGAEWAFLRHEVTLPEQPAVAWATLFVTGASAEPARQPVYRVSVNGTELGTGPVRSIGSETRYDGLDATAHLHAGRNAVGVVAWTVDDQRVQVELVVGLTDGSVRTVGTSAAWQARPGATAYPTAGSIGTGYYAAPSEDLVAEAYPWGFDRPDHPATGWAPAVERPPFAELLPDPAEKVVTTTSPPRSVRRVAPGVLLLDFGRTHLGGLALAPGALGTPAGTEPDAAGTTAESSGRRPDPEVDLRIRYGELLDEAGRVRHRMATGNHARDRWRLTGAPGTEPVRTWGLRVFRYVEVEGLPEGTDPRSLHALGHVYPLGERTTIRTGSPGLDQVLELCESTLVQTNGNLLVDAWSREREPYEADAYLQARCDAALSADTVLAGYSLDYLLHRRTWPTEWPFYLVLYAWEQHLRDGDLDALGRRRDLLAALLPDRWLDPRLDLVRKEHGSDGSGSRRDHDIVDWPASERDGYRFGPVNTVVNAIAVGAYTAMGRIDAALGLPGAREHERTADRLRQAMHRLLWDEAVGAYRDGLDAAGRPIEHHAAHATAFALAMDAVPAHSVARAGRHLADRGMVVSVYAAPFLLTALLRAGLPDAALALLTGTGLRSWQEMIRAGAGATTEAWSERLKPNMSAAHPWAASPLFLVVEEIAGIRPTGPGFRRFEVAPVLPARLGRLSVRRPTGAGRIDVDLRRGTDGLHVRVVVPPGTTGTLRLPGLTRDLPPGTHDLLAPGPQHPGAG
jgi:alpha-L-rhamnosidase